MHRVKHILHSLIPIAVCLEQKWDTNENRHQFSVSLGSVGVKINRLTYSPMPILHPAPGKISAAIEASEIISGVIKADVKIVRTVNKIKLPVGCYIHQGVQYGSWCEFVWIMSTNFSQCLCLF